jgi:hypothetical protein
MPAEITLAYHNDPALKRKIVTQLAAHREAGELVKGERWRNGKGGAVGCAIHSRNFAEYETCLGIPRMLARLEDHIFDELLDEKAQLWPEQFMAAITPGSDLSRVGWTFLYWLLTDVKINPGINHPVAHEAVRQCADVIAPLTNGCSSDRVAAASAAHYAREVAFRALADSNIATTAENAAEWARASALDSAVCSATSAEESAMSAATRHARVAAWHAEKSADMAARSVASAAKSAAGRARKACKAEESAMSARAAAFVHMADKLIELLQLA